MATELDRAVFNAIRDLGDPMRCEIIRYGNLPLRRERTVKTAIGRLLHAKLIQGTPGERPWYPWRYTLARDAEFPEPPIELDDEPVPQRIITRHIGDVPGAVLAKIGLAGLCRQMGVE
jgi:hypothetical protein